MILQKTSRAFLSAYRKGRAAAKEGLPKISPYPDLRGGRFDHIVTWSRSFHKYWMEGYNHQRTGLPEAYTADGPKKAGERV
jgi:hypothetical protein